MNPRSRMQAIGRFAGAWLPWARRLFIPVAVGFLAYSAWRASDRLAPLLATMSLGRLLLAWLCWCAAQWIGPLTTVAFGRAMDLPLGYRQLSLISVLRLPAKYLPGGIWQSVARFASYRRHEISRADSLTILFGEHLLALGVSAALGSLLLLQIDTTRSMHEAGGWVLAVATALLAATTLGICKVRGGGGKILAGVLAAMAATALFWIAAAAAFCAYWTAAFGSGGADLPRLAACYLISWAAGFVAIFAPQGLGVFEWVAGHLLMSTQPLSVTIVAVAGFRVVTIAADLSVWLAGLVIVRIGSARAP